jgi:hypothetical protein
MRPLTSILILIGILLPGAGHARASPAQKCQAALYKAAGKRAACTYNTGARSVMKGTVPDYNPCEVNYAKHVAATNAKYGAACPAYQPVTVPIARCSLTGESCANPGCSTPATVEGVCLGVAGCVYAPLDAAPTTATCNVNGGGTATIAESRACRFLYEKSGCPAGTRCVVFLGPGLCTNSAGSSASYLCGSGEPCSSDADCTLTGLNECVKCGDEAVQGNEDCEFDRCGSQCSPTCQFAGRCLDKESLVCDKPCATDADCGPPFGAYACIAPAYCP